MEGREKRCRDGVERHMISKTLISKCLILPFQGQDESKRMVFW